MSMKEHKAEAEDEISFDVGVMLQVLQKTLDGWWLVRWGALPRIKAHFPSLGIANARNLFSLLHELPRQLQRRCFRPSVMFQTEFSHAFRDKMSVKQLNKTISWSCKARNSSAILVDLPNAQEMVSMAGKLMINTTRLNKPHILYRIRAIPALLWLLTWKPPKSVMNAYDIPVMPLKLCTPCEIFLNCTPYF